MNKVIAKYKEQGCEILVGTCGSPDYLAVARDRRTGARLAVKFIWQGMSLPGGKPAAFFGIRLRLVGSEETVTDMKGPAKKKPKAPHDWASAFKFPWQKTGGNRRSLMAGVVIGRSPKDAWMSRYDLATIDFTTQVIDWLVKKAPRSSWLISPETLASFLNDQVEEALAEFPAPTKEYIEAQVAKKEEAIATLKQEMAALIEQIATTADAKELVTPTAHAVQQFMPIDELNAKIWNSKPKAALSLVHDADAESGDGEDEGDEEEDGDNAA